MGVHHVRFIKNHSMCCTKNKKKKIKKKSIQDSTEFQSASLHLCVSHHLAISNLMRISTSKIAHDFHKLIRIEYD